jgi:hypothetical protein
MGNVRKRGPSQFQARVRRNGRNVSKTFATRTEAEEWAMITVGIEVT